MRTPNRKVYIREPGFRKTGGLPLYSSTEKVKSMYPKLSAVSRLAKVLS
jgi:hypothetical protein